ncbi:ribosome biogenesis protein Nop16 [Xylariaceae sp. FL0804]|nr:ribosome biogenesis protein Nop16 [Xylariaceae sp. FL0804]
MGRELQKRKKRSSRPTVRQPTSTRSSKRLLNPLGNSTVAKNWNKNETTTQNYRRLGLVSRLRAPTGGVEPPRLDTKKPAAAAAATTKQKKKSADPFAIAAGSGTAVVSEARVERDAEGRIVRVVHAHLDGTTRRKKRPRANPLNDPLTALDSDYSDDDDDDDDPMEQQEEEQEEEEEEEQGRDGGGGIVRQLEREAARPVERRPRGQSAREAEWLARLVAAHGDDARAMARDRRLNPMQQTEADIARRVAKWKKGRTG